MPVANQHSRNIIESVMIRVITMVKKMIFETGMLAQRLQAAMRSLLLEAGETLFRAGDAARGIFILKSGRVRLLRRCHEGREVTLHTPRPGESFAEASLYAESYHCDCIADIASEVILVPRQILLRELEREPAYAALFARHLAAQIRDLRAALELRNIRTADQRILSALTLKLAPGENSVCIEPSLKAFASEIGLTHEALYRSLKKLENSGKLHRDGRCIRLYFC